MIHPLESRYRTEISNIFEERARMNIMVEIEVALAKVHSDTGLITNDEYNKILEGSKNISLDRIKEIENTITHHDIMAVVQALTEASNVDKIHIGATSNDIVDTTTAVQLKRAHKVILQDLNELIKKLLNRSRETIDLVAIGRTHGQHALPMTYGMKFALWAYELFELKKKLDSEQFYGKMSGAIGTFASFGENGFDIQAKVMKELGLVFPEISNQVVPRIFITQYLFKLILVAMVIEKIAKEIRNLQRTEINEIAEPFAKKQVGSSTMPHKRNPHKCENLCSIAKRLRTNILPALENISLEHERDLTNSANERIIIPEIIILTHYMIEKMIFIIDGLDIFEDNIKRNLKLSSGIYMEKTMMELIRKGHGRQESYQKAKEISSSKIIKPEEYIGLAKEITKKIIQQISLD